ncbi:TIGR03067 domain-containing protein [Gemmata sp. JC717]|uniref:TIGR03067 domain-containing protein n=1 Tax=Gemmata algarum TaxID=2975278 RepID=UPI0021BB2BEE|nr:TIGR03067 domain-containing protein [Gemmata algarum]MDY3554322.1 TIGR03067 domain-containing protein [Gemmata algarum]
MSRSGLLLVLTLLVVGCGQKPKSNPPPPPPQDSGADMAPGAMRKGEEKGEGRGHPHRLMAGTWRAVRDHVTVSVEAMPKLDDDDDFFMVAVYVQNRSPNAAVQFTNWKDPGQVTLKDATGKRYPLVPISALVEKSLRETKTESAPAYGAGPVLPDQARMTFLKFDRAVQSAEYLDLDLDGAPVGFQEPILFRIPKEVLGARTPAQEKAVKDELAKVQGKWRLVSIERDGKRLGPPAGVEAFVTVKGDQWTVTVTKRDGGSECTIRMDPATDPGTFDLIQTTKLENGEPFKIVEKGIYKLEGGTLTVCTNQGVERYDPTRPRPTSFQSGGGNSVRVLQRVDK